MILVALFLPSQDRVARIPPLTLLPHSIDAPPTLNMDHLSSTTPSGCIQAPHSYKLTRITTSKNIYLCRRPVQPKHLHCADLKARTQNTVNNLPYIPVNNNVGLNHKAWTVIEASRGWFNSKKVLELFGSWRGWIAPMNCSFCSFWAELCV